MAVRGQVRVVSSVAQASLLPQAEDSSEVALNHLQAVVSSANQTLQVHQEVAQEASSASKQTKLLQVVALALVLAEALDSRHPALPEQAQVSLVNLKVSQITASNNSTAKAKLSLLNLATESSRQCSLASTTTTETPLASKAASSTARTPSLLSTKTSKE